MKSKKLSYNKILVLFCIIVVLVSMTGCGDPGEPGEPIVGIFYVDPSTINQGESSTLTWNVNDADTITITSIGTVTPSGSTPVSPVVTTVYILTATNSAGSVTASATVTVIPFIPCTTGTLSINIDDNYTYWVYIDEVLWGTSDWNGDITLYNVPLGYHTIYVQSTEIPYYCQGNAYPTINCGVNNVFITVFCII
jgi:hypothetical protein